MSLRLYHAHTGEALPTIPLVEKVSTPNELQARIQHFTSIPSNRQVLLTGQGRDVTADFLASGSGEIFVYDERAINDEQSPQLLTINVAGGSELDNKERITAGCPVGDQDLQNLTSWEDFRKSTRPWANGILDRLTMLGESVVQQRNRNSIINHGIIIKSTNLNSQFASLRTKYQELRDDANDVLPGKTAKIASWAASLDALESIYVSKDFRFLREEMKTSHGPGTGSLIDYVDKDNVQRMGSKLHHISTAYMVLLGKFTEAENALKPKVDEASAVNLSSPEGTDVDKTLEELRRYLDNALNNSQLHPSGDYPSFVELLPELARAHASLCGEHNLLETTYHILQEALDTSLQETRAAQKTAVELMKASSSIRPLIQDFTTEISKLTVEGDPFDIVNQTVAAPTFYGAFLIEAIRRQEWRERTRVTIRQRPTELSIACDAESQRRQQWTQSMKSVLSTSAASEAMAVSVTELGVLEGKNTQKWPTANEKDVENYIAQLERKGMFQAVKDLNEMLAGTPIKIPSKDDNSGKTDDPMHNGLRTRRVMTNPLDASTANADESLKEETISSLQRENAKVKKESRGMKAQLQKLELLLHKQQPFTPSLYDKAPALARTSSRDESANSMSRRIEELESQLQKAINPGPAERGSPKSPVPSTRGIINSNSQQNNRPPSRLRAFADESEIRNQVLMEYRKHGDNVQELTQLIKRLSEEGQAWRKEAQSQQTEKKVLFERATSVETERNWLKTKVESQAIEILETRNSLVEEKARTAVHFAELERLKHHITELEEVIRGYESTEKENQRTKCLQEKLEDAQSHSETMRAKLSAMEEKDQNLRTKYNERGARARVVSEQLYSQIQQLGQMAELIGFSIVRQENDGQLSVRRTSKAKKTALPDGDAEGITIVPAIERAESTRWCQEANDENTEAATFDSFLASIQSFPLDTFCKSIIKRIRDIEGLARKCQRDTASHREKGRRTQTEAYNKIAFRGFREGDLALFLPTHNLVARSWAAFNVGEPHYFLKEQTAHQLGTRDWLLARITNIKEKVVDMSRGVGRDQSKSKLLPTTPFAPEDRGRPESLQSAADSDGSASSSVYDEDENPFGLPDGMKWYLVEASEEKAGAPSTPRGPGKTTVAPACVDVSGDMKVKQSDQPSDDSKVGAEKGRGGIAPLLSRELSLVKDSPASEMSNREASRLERTEASSDKQDEASSPVISLGREKEEG